MRAPEAQAGRRTVPFVPLAAPMLDFAVISLAPHRAGLLAPEPFTDGTLYLEPVGDAKDGLWLASSAPARVHRWPGGACGVSGLGMLNDGLFMARAPARPEQIEALSPDQGQYSRFVIRDGEATVQTDVFGFGTVFEYAWDGVAIVSNRAHMVSILLAALGRPPKPDWVYVTASLFSEHGFFAQQNALSRTAVEGVRPSEATNTLLVSAGQLVRRQHPDAGLLTSSDSYGTSLELGVEQIVSSVRAAVTCESVEQTVVDVTAGKDSRLVLGALLGSTGWKDRVSFNTLGAESSPDVRIASTLVDLVGGRFYTGHDESVLRPVTLEWNTDFWLSYYAGEYHRFGAASHSPLGANRTELGVGGACGELFRGFWTEVVQDHIQTSATAAELATRLVSAASQPEWRSHAYLDAVADDLAADLERGAGETLEDMVEDHYLRHRNRSHCGMRGFTLVHERAVWYPLLSSNLFAAARSLDHGERSSNRVIFDVLARLHPALVDVPFGGGYPFGRVQRELRSGPERIVLNIQESASTEAWSDATRRRHVHTSRRRQGPQSLVWAEMAGRIHLQATRALQRVEEIGLSAEVAAALQRRMDALFDASARRGYQLAMRILAIDALLAPPPFAAVPGPGLRQD